MVFFYYYNAVEKNNAKHKIVTVKLIIIFTLRGKKLVFAIFSHVYIFHLSACKFCNSTFSNSIRQSHDAPPTGNWKEFFKVQYFQFTMHESWRTRTWLLRPEPESNKYVHHVGCPSKFSTRVDWSDASYYFIISMEGEDSEQWSTS